MTQRSWCFTLNNYTFEEQLNLEEVDCRYLIIGYEVGAEGTKHIQGYIEFNGPKRFGAVKKLISERAHIEARKGTRDQARDYCMKDGEFLEFGDWEKGGQGRRNDLDAIRQLAIEDGMRAVVAVAKNTQQIRLAEKYLEYNEEPRDWKPEVEWIWGPTGVGKTKTAIEKLGTEDLYQKKTGTKWWTGYDNHTNVLIDDFRDSWWSLTDMLSLLDRYERRIECKGGERQFRAKRIIVTSAFAPEDCYKGCGENIAQLLRRIDFVTKLGNEVEEVILDSSTNDEPIEDLNI